MNVCPVLCQLLVRTELGLHTVLISGGDIDPTSTASRIRLTSCLAEVLELEQLSLSSRSDSPAECSRNPDPDKELDIRIPAAANTEIDRR